MTDEEIDNEFNKLSNKKYTDDDIKSAFDKEEYVNKLSEKGPLAEADVKENLNSLFSMLKDKDKYEFSKPSYLTVIIGTLLYVISPIDLVPDVIPVLGLLDDAAIVAAATGTIAVEIARYKEWKKEKDK